MCGGLNIVYGVKEIEYDNSGLAPSPDVTFYIHELSKPEPPLVDDLILNKDGCFYKVTSISGDVIETTRLTLQGSGPSGGGPSSDSSSSWSIGMPVKAQSYVFSSTAEKMEIAFKANYQNPSEDVYISYVAFTLGAAMDDQTLPFYEFNPTYSFNTAYDIDLSQYKHLFSSAAAKKVYINAADNYGVIHSQEFSVKLVDISLTAERDVIIKANGDAYTYKCYVGGSKEGFKAKKLVFNFYNEGNLNTPAYTYEDTSLNSNYIGSWSSNLPLDKLSHGSYVLEVQALGTISTSSTPLPSNILKHKIIKFVTDGGNDILAYSLPDAIEQYTNIPMNYYLASAQNNKEYSLSVKVDGKEVASLIVTTNTLSSHPLYFENKGNYTLSLSVIELGLEYTQVIEVIEYNGTLPVIDPNDQNLMLYLTPRGRSNNSSNKDKWPDYHNRYTGELTSMYYSNSSGWLEDEDGTSYLLLTSGGKMSIPGFEPFAQDPTQENEQNSAMGSGMTIELDFEVNGITDFDADLIKCVSVDNNENNTVGFAVTGTQVKFFSGLKNGTSTNALTNLTIVEGKRIRLSFVIEPNDNNEESLYFPMCYAYLNGILSAAVMYDKKDTFVQSAQSPARLYIDSTAAQIKIYGIRVYTTALRDNRILENYTATLPTLEERQARYDSNNVINDSNLVDFEMVSSDKYDLQIPYMVITGGYKTDPDNDKWRLLPENQVGKPQLPTSKKDYRLIDVQVVYPKNDYFKRYKNYSYVNTFDNGLGMTENFGNRAANGGCIMYAQGTSSMEYPVKNLRLRWKKEANFFQVHPDIENVEIICMKADYMESSGSHNTGAANLIDDLYSGPGLKSPGQAHFGPTTAEPNRKRIVTCIKGHPCLIFYSPTGKQGSYEFVGKYNLNLDKATPTPFGFNHDDAFGWLSEGEEYWQVQYGTENEETKEWEEVFVGQADPDEGADYVTDQVETKAIVQPGEKINSIHCFEFLDNAVAVCNFLNKSISSTDTTPSEFSFVLNRNLPAKDYKPNTFFLYDPSTKDFVVDESADFDESKHYFEKSFTYHDTWYNTFKNADDEDVPGWMLGFESRYPEDRVGYHDADALYPLASWLNELQTMKDLDIATGEWDPTSITYTYEYTQENGEFVVGKEYFKKISDNEYEKVILRREEFETTGPYYTRRVIDSKFKNDCLERFKREYECYLDKNFTLFYYIVTEALLMADSRVKNLMFATWGKSARKYKDLSNVEHQTNNYIFYPIFYDMDTMLGLDNTGRNRFKYYEEDTDSDLYNGDEVLWNFVRDALFSDLGAMYRSLENAMLNVRTEQDGSWLPRSVIPYFNNNQANMANEAFYNGDALYKYLDPARNGYYDGLNGKDIAPGAGPYLYAAQGDRTLMRENFLINRIKFLRGKYSSSDFQNADQIEFRWNFPSAPSTSDEELIAKGEWLALSAKKVPPTTKFTFEALQPCFAGVMLGKNGSVYKDRLEKEEIKDIDVPEGRSANNTEAYLLGLGSLKDLGDLSDKYVQKFVISGKTKLSSLRLGNPHKYYHNPYWSSDTSDSKIILSGCNYLQYFNLQNCSSFQSGLNFSTCPIIETILLTGSKTSSLTLPLNGNIQELRLPSTIKSLYIDSHQNLQASKFSMGTYDYGSDDEIGGPTGRYVNDFTNLTDLCVINTPIDTYDIVTNAISLNSYYIHDFEWTLTNSANDTQYVSMPKDTAPLEGTDYYMWNKDLKAYVKVGKVDKEDSSLWPKFTEKITLVENGAITRIPVLEQLKTKTAKKGTSEVAKASALVGTINIAARAKVNQFELYQKYHGTYPNVNLTYDVEAIGADNFTPAYTIKFYNINNVTVETEPHYTVLTDGSYTLRELVSAEGPAGFSMTAPVKQATNTKTYTFTGRWKVVGTDTYYDQKGTDFDNLIPEEDLLLEPEYEEKDRVYQVNFYDYEGKNPIPVDYYFDQVMIDNPATPTYLGRPDTGLKEHERYGFKGWIGEKDFINKNPKPDFTNLNTRRISHDGLNLYPFYEVEDATQVATSIDYFTFRETTIPFTVYNYTLANSGDTASTTIDFANEYVVEVKEGCEKFLSGKITIPSKDKNGRYATAIGDFRKNTNITHVYLLPDSKCKILGTNAGGSGGFNNMSNLTLLYLPENLTSLEIINDNCFLNDVKLKNIMNLPSTVKYIGQSAFAQCGQLELTKLPDSIEYIGIGAFLYCQSITLESFPPKYTQIMERTFQGCVKLKVTHFGNSTNGAVTAADNNVTHIGNNSFYQPSYTNLNNIYLHSSVTFINSQAFYRYGVNDNFVIKNGSTAFDSFDPSKQFGSRNSITIEEDDSH